MKRNTFLNLGAAMENQVDLSDLGDIEGFVPNRNLIIYGNLESGEWENILMESNRVYTVIVASSDSVPSLETQQLQEYGKQLCDDLVKDSMKVYLTPAEQGHTLDDSLLTQIKADPEDSVVVMGANVPSDDPSRLIIEQTGAVVVASMEDAMLYIVTAC